MAAAVPYVPPLPPPAGPAAVGAGATDQGRTDGIALVVETSAVFAALSQRLTPAMIAEITADVADAEDSAGALDNMPAGAQGADFASHAAYRLATHIDTLKGAAARRVGVLFKQSVIDAQLKAYQALAPLQPQPAPHAGDPPPDDDEIQRFVAACTPLEAGPKGLGLVASTMGIALVAAGKPAQLQALEAAFRAQQNGALRVGCVTLARNLLAIATQAQLVAAQLQPQQQAAAARPVELSLNTIMQARQGRGPVPAIDVQNFAPEAIGRLTLLGQYASGKIAAVLADRAGRPQRTLRARVAALWRRACGRPDCDS